MRDQANEPSASERKVKVTKWPFWRRMMLAGALWILAVMIVFKERQTSVLAAFAFSIGYGFLMVGFWFAMRDKRAAATRSQASEEHPDDREEREHT